jgi:phage major head subunit gpT-like protein
MDINIFTTMMRAEFLKAMQATPAKQPPWEKFTQIVPSTARIENYAWMTPAPGISRYLGHRRYAQLDQIKYTVENLEFDGSLTVALRDVWDDQIGGYKYRFQDLGEKAKIFPGRHVLQTLALGGSTTCFDGTNFFANTHTMGGYASSVPAGFGGGANNLTFTSANSADAATYKMVFLLNYGPLKPLLYQNRRGPDLANTAGTPQALEAKRANYWVDLEGAAAFGYWWDSILITITNTPSLADMFTCIDAAMKQFLTFTLPGALPTDPSLYVHQDLQFTPDVGTIVCSTGLWALLRHALMEDRVGVSVAGSTAGITSNIFYNLFGLVASGYLN